MFSVTFDLYYENGFNFDEAKILLSGKALTLALPNI